MTKAQKAEQAEAIERLRGWIKEGDTIYTVLRHVSSSGMTRTIQLVGIDIRHRCPECGHISYSESGRIDHKAGCSLPLPVPYGEPMHFGWNAAKALGYKYDREREGIRIGGCGMDMGFHLVYDLSRILFNGNGYALNHRWI